MQRVNFVLLLPLPLLGFYWTKAYLWTGGFLYSTPCVGYLNHKYLAQMGKSADRKMRTGVLLITLYNLELRHSDYLKPSSTFH